MASGVWHALGRVSYPAALAIQGRVAAEREQDLRPDTLLLLEHPPTVTLGRRASQADVLWEARELAMAGIGVERVGRGGRATYHGPGQLVGYPIVRLTGAGRGVRRFVETLEAMLLDVVAAFGVRADRLDGHPGAWIEGRKIASIGIEVHHGISRHGFALNVDMDLAPFASIVPCGTRGLELIDLARAARVRVDMESATAAVIAAWRSRFGAIEEERLNVVEALG